jgi:hypothetical protein
MKQFPLILRVTATAMLAAAERILDPGLAAEIAGFASLDSQNKIYEALTFTQQTERGEHTYLE